MDRGAWWAIIHEVTKSWTQLKYHGMHALTQLASVWARLSTPNPAPHRLLALLGIMKSM